MILPLVAERRHVYVLNDANTGVGINVTYVIVDTNTSGWSDVDNRRFTQSIVSHGFVVLNSWQGIATFVRHT